MSVIFKITLLLTFHMLISLYLTMVNGKFIESNITTIHDNHSEYSSIADQVEIIHPNIRQSLPTKQKNRLNKDPKFLSEQVEIFSKKNQTYKAVPGTTDKETYDGKPLKFVSSRPLFVYRNEKKKQQQQQQQFQQSYGGYEFAYPNHNSVDNTYPYPYPFSYYTSHGVFHYYPYGRPFGQ